MSAGFIGGAVSGAVSGGTATGGNPFGIAAGALIGGFLTQRAEARAEDAQRKAMRDAEMRRRMSIAREFEARQQADATALAGLSRERRPTSEGPPGQITQQGGAIGAAIQNTSGTF